MLCSNEWFLLVHAVSNQDSVYKVCSDPQRIKGSFLDSVYISNTRAIKTSLEDDLDPDLCFPFWRSCLDLIYHKTCLTSTDCIYSSTCLSNSVCQIPQNHVNLTITCIYENAPSRLIPYLPLTVDATKHQGYV